jgi:FeS assembly SUF system protein
MTKPADTKRDGKGKRPVYNEAQGKAYLDTFLKGDGDQKPKEPSPPVGEESLKERIVQALSQIFDPEIPVNIYDLGLIYGIDADANGNVTVTMTLTTPHCPVAETMPGEVEMRVGYVEGVQDVKVKLVWDPPWDPSKMSEAARLELGFM